MPAEIMLGGASVRLDVSGCAMLIGEGALLVADLHLEKGSSYARGRQFLPPYDTLATLARLSEVVARLAPRQIVVLGDAFHDRHAGERLPREAVAAIGALATGRRLVWIAGNHDPAPPVGLPGER
ncbi:MAG TPA: metallophosphoesterase, partial [Beijerinckiaceae bacterium]|nr:metallophosphoesterase [Beijerinckiaceae bacterium]